MRALCLHQGKLCYRDALPTPALATDHCLVRVIQAGICSTDIGLLHGMYEFEGVLGHEFVGFVEQGPDQLLQRRVVGDINISCECCQYCLAGMKKHCEQRRVLGIRDWSGAFAEYLALPMRNLTVVPDTVSNDEAVFAEPLAAAMDVLAQLQVADKDFASHRLLLVGDGRMAQLIARVLALYSDQITVLGKHQDKLARLPNDLKRVDSVTELSPRSFDYVVECTGNASGFDIALALVKARGVIILKSTYPSNVSLDATRIVVDELQIKGSRCGNFTDALRLLESKQISVTELIDGRFGLLDADRAFVFSRQKSVIKTLFDIAMP